MGKGNAGAADVAALEERIGYVFRNKELAGEALTHASRSHEIPGMSSNERLEFLGDAVLGFLVADYIFRSHPGMAEGGMTSTRASVVSKPALARLAVQIGLPGLMLTGKDLSKTGRTDNETVLSDAVEAVIAAIYLDSGLREAAGFILPRLQDDIARAAEAGVFSDSKSRLQEYLQRNGEVQIEYALDAAAGAPHDRTFTVSVVVNGERLAQGSGRNKKDAQQDAAGKALARIMETNESGSSQSAPEKT